MAVYREAPKCSECGEKYKSINKDMGNDFVGDTFIRWDVDGHICQMQEKGKYVNRSTYQKLAEENKKLLYDIRILTAEVDGIPPVEKILVLHKWREKFKRDADFDRELKEFLFGKKS